MEQNLLHNMVQASIGYTFNNIDLLDQAFTRRSFSQENGGEDNEILEFIGDKVLDFAVVKLLSERFGHITEECPHRFESELDEDNLSRIKSRMVQKNNLAKRIDELRYAEALIMGKGDIANGIQNENSVKEDLFEAILGAVAIDCKWDLETLVSVVDVMLDPDDFLQDDNETNYVRLIHEWDADNGTTPLFWFKNQSYQASWYLPFDGISQPVNMNSVNIGEYKYTCELKLLNDLPLFRGFGRSKREARMHACEVAYNFLERNEMIFTIQDEIDDPNKADAINQLEILARRGYFDLPTYEFMQDYDKDGNPVWTAVCHVTLEDGEVIYERSSSSKKDAKKEAAFAMLMYVLGNEER